MNDADELGGHATGQAMSTPPIPIVEAILKKLTNSLPKNLTYHAVAHTEEVLADVITLGTHDNLSQRELHLLQVAAAFHDAGFLWGRAGHEERGALYATEEMRSDGSYAEEEIDQVAQLIRDTKLVQQSGELRQIPTSTLAGYLLDADLGNLGRSDFFDKLELERQEVPVASEEEFQRRVLNILSSKQWYTAAGRMLREPIWRQNLEIVRNRLEK